MRTKLLIHYAKDRNGGEFRRIARLSKDSDKVLGSDTVELVFLPIRYLFSLKGFKKNELGSRLILLPVLFPFTRFLFVKKLNHALAGLFAKYFYNRIKPDVVWGETLAGNSIAVTIKGPHKYIADFHGASPEESYYYSPNKEHLQYSNTLEAEVVNKADYLVVQSYAMKHHLIEKYLLQSSDKIVVYHCGVDTILFDYNKTNRTELRQQLGYSNNDIVFVYAGGTNKWQMLDYTLEVFGQVSHCLPNAKCLMLIQGDISFYENYCSNNNIKNVRFLSNVPYDKVRDYLSICDYSWLLREDIILNRVASPTKLGEYLSCGLVVVTTDVVNSWDWLDNDKAVIVPLIDPVSAAHIIKEKIEDYNNLEITKKEMREIAISTLSTEKDFKSLSQIAI